MKNPLLLAVFCIAIFLLIAFYFVSGALYKQRHNDKYHFYQMFPYELNYPSVFKDNTFGNVMFILASFAVATFYILNPYTSIYKTITIIVAIVFTMLLICLLLMPLYYLKTHLVLSTVAMTLSLALPLFNLFFVYGQYKIEVEQAKRILCIISMVFSGLLAVVMLVLIMNPRLTFKIYLDKKVDEQGNEVLKRPRVIFLALNEWMSIFIYFLTPISLLLISLI